MEWHAGTSMLKTTVPNHMFVGYPVEMADESRFLFDICKSNNSKCTDGH